MVKKYQLLQEEHVASIREIQKNPSKILQGITRVMRGSNTLGFFFSNDEFDELLEDLEAMGSKELKKRVREARTNIKSGKKATVSLDKLAMRYGA